MASPLTTPTFSPCDLPVVTDVCGVGKTVVQAADFASNPLGYIASAMQSAASGFAKVLLPNIEQVTHPDLSQAWFISTYELTFALSIFVFVVFLLYNFALMSQRKISGDDVFDSLVKYSPAYLFLTISGPAVGTFLLKLTGALSDSIIGVGGGSTADTGATLQKAIDGANADNIPGGDIITIIFSALIIIALLLVFMTLLVLTVTLYLTGVIMPLSLVWLVHPRQRSKGFKLVYTWLGLCFSHVLLFILLTAAFGLVGHAFTSFSDNGLQEIADLAVAVIAMFTASLAPFKLLKFAPVGPSGSESLSGVSVPQRRIGGGSSFTPSATDSSTAQLARSTGPVAASPSPGGSGPQPGGLLMAVARGQGPGPGGATGGTTGSASGGATGGTATRGAPSPVGSLTGARAANGGAAAGAGGAPGGAAAGGGAAAAGAATLPVAAAAAGARAVGQGAAAAQTSANQGAGSGAQAGTPPTGVRPPPKSTQSTTGTAPGGPPTAGATPASLAAGPTGGTGTAAGQAPQAGPAQDLAAAAGAGGAGPSRPAAGGRPPAGPGLGAVLGAAASGLQATARAAETAARIGSQPLEHHEGTEGREGGVTGHGTARPGW